MGRTPQRVIDLLKAEIPGKISLNRFCKLSGINPNSVDKYLAGDTEPTQATLEKLAKYFGVSVAWLRGEYEGFTYEQAAELKSRQDTFDNLKNELEGFGIRHKSELELLEKYKELSTAFMKIPADDMNEARDLLLMLTHLKKSLIGSE